MGKTSYVELGGGRAAVRIPILYEDRAVLAIDKPRGWMLVPFTWQDTPWNLQAAIQSSIGAGAFWARSRHLRFLRYVHRLDAETTGVLLLGKSPGAVQSLGALFGTRRMEKRYLAVVRGVPATAAWTCRLRIGRDPDHVGRRRVDARNGKEAETDFRVVESREGITLIEARPLTGRTHQIRLHLAAAHLPILGDALYGGGVATPLGLRAVELRYVDPFLRRPVRVTAPEEAFLREFGFGPSPVPVAGEGSDPAPVRGAGVYATGRRRSR